MILKPLLVAGVMTGNSLDAVDAVICKVDENGIIEDLASHSLLNKESLVAALKSLRAEVIAANGDVKIAEKSFDSLHSSKHGTFKEVHFAYLMSVFQCIDELKRKSGLTPELLGFHGQTCAHNPPSIVGAKDRDKIYTVQLGNGQELADLLNLPVVYDFRSDDIFEGGEAAPLATLHHEHLAAQIKQKGFFPIAFCNAGNTGNITLITQVKNSSKLITVGWDSGPFNHFSDYLMRTEKGLACDTDGQIGKQGNVNLGLLEKLFNTSAVTDQGKNFIEKSPPKSSDPQWYRNIPELTDASLSFEDRLRTVQYFGVYSLVFNLSLVANLYEIPKFFALCGGGWRNPVITNHFQALLSGDVKSSPILPIHDLAFKEIVKLCAGFEAKPSRQFGFDDQAMEARIFVDAAVCRILGKEFTRPDTTNADKACVLGILRFPRGDISKTPAILKTWLDKYYKHDLTKDLPSKFDAYWSRAAAGWKAKILSK